ncbi:MAG: host-nuclease inhibitor Gam family protein [Pseudomonadota bacterium]
MDIAAPETKAEAQALCERYAQLASHIAAREAARDEALAEINGVADRYIEPLLEERSAVAAALEPWFFANRDELLDGKRKSFELGGCVLSARMGRATLGVAGDKDEVALKLSKLDWAKDAFVKTKVSLDVPAIKRGLGDKAARPKLARYGLKIVPGEEAFHIDRTEQGGTQAKIG